MNSCIPLWLKSQLLPSAIPKIPLCDLQNPSCALLPHLQLTYALLSFPMSVNLLHSHKDSAVCWNPMPCLLLSFRPCAFDTLAQWKEISIAELQAAVMQDLWKLTQLIVLGCIFLLTWGIKQGTYVSIAHLTHQLEYDCSLYAIF